MSEFEPTQAEKDALTYLEWDDAALGRFTKHVACTLAKVQGDSDGLHKVTAASCAMMLVGAAVDANAETVRLYMEDHTHAEIPTGDWVVIVQRTKAPPTDGAPVEPTKVRHPMISESTALRIAQALERLAAAVEHKGAPNIQTTPSSHYGEVPYCNSCGNRHRHLTACQFPFNPHDTASYY